MSGKLGEDGEVDERVGRDRGRPHPLNESGLVRADRHDDAPVVLGAQLVHLFGDDLDVSRNFAREGQTQPGEEGKDHGTDRQKSIFFGAAAWPPPWPPPVPEPLPSPASAVAASMFVGSMTAAPLLSDLCSATASWYR